MGCGSKPTYGSKAAANRHGSITYGRGNYTVRPVSGGYRAYRK